MQTPRLLPLRLRAAGIAIVAAVAAACSDDNGLTARDECTTLRQSQADIESGRAEGMARVRLNLVSRLGVESASTEQLSINGADLFVDGECYRLESSSSMRLADLENAMGTLAAEASVEPGNVTHVLLRVSGPQGGTRTYSADKLAMEEPVTLRAGSRTDIYLALDPVGTTGNRVATTIVASGMMPWNATTMVMDPVRGGKMTMPGGFEMEMPSGSITEATVFGVSEIQSGDVSSTYAIIPESELNEPVTIKLRVDRSRIPQGLTMADYGGRVAGAAAVSSVEGNVATVTAAKGLGHVRMGTSVPYVETTGGLRAAIGPRPQEGPAPGPALVDNECYRRLVNERATLYNLLAQNYGVRSFQCENVPPYVHIVIVNLSRAGLSTYPRIHFPNVQNADNTLQLREISTHITQVNEFAAINGFTWTGDKGFEWGGTGTAIGTVYLNYERVSPWYTGSEVMVGFGAWNPTYGTPTKFFDRPAGVGLDLTGYTEWMVPGTTSIIKNGACSRTPGGEVDRWSTLGIGGGLLVMASSASYTTTDAYTLCSVYEGLNVLGGALRLDGGSASGISWLGTTLNPLTGSDFTAFGNERHIAYAVAAVYP